MSYDVIKVRAVVKIRGQMFDVQTSGDWGGGSESAAVADAINALKSMKLAALITLHETLLAEQETHDMLRTAFADAALCRSILNEHANPPEVDGAPGAALHIRAIAKEDVDQLSWKGT